MLVVSEVHALIVDRGIHWKIDGELKTPSEDDVARVLDKMRETLYASDDNDQIEIGHLIGIKTEHGLDIYLHIGEYNGNEEG